MTALDENRWRQKKTTEIRKFIYTHISSCWCITKSYLFACNLRLSIYRAYAFTHSLALSHSHHLVSVCLHNLLLPQCRGLFRKKKKKLETKTKSWQRHPVHHPRVSSSKSNRKSRSTRTRRRARTQSYIGRWRARASAIQLKYPSHEHWTQLSDQIAFVGVDIPAIAVFSSSTSSSSAVAAAAAADLSFCSRARASILFSVCDADHREMVKLKPVCIFIIDLWTWIVYHWIFMYISFTKLLFYFVFIFFILFYFFLLLYGTRASKWTRWTRSNKRARAIASPLTVEHVQIYCNNNNNNMRSLDTFYYTWRVFSIHFFSHGPCIDPGIDTCRTDTHAFYANI